MAQPITPPLMRKKSFLRSGEGATANFNYTDIASGVGYTTYYLGTSYGGATAYELTPSVYESQDGKISTSTEKNFDTGTFNLPRTLRGTAIAILGIYNSAGGTKTVGVRLIKVAVGGAETELVASVTSAALSTSTAGTYNRIPLAITGKKLIGKGEKVRLEIIPQDTLDLGTDPTGTTRGVQTATRSLLILPFEVQV